MFEHYLSIIILLPFLGAIFQIFNHPSTKWVGLLTSCISSLLSVVAIVNLNQGNPGGMVSETASWIGAYSIHYHLGLDGLNVVLVLLLSFLFPLLFASEWNRTNGPRGMVSLYLLLQSALLGTVLSQDLFLLLFFWSFSALPLFFLLGIWGDRNRERAALHFIVTSSVGNAFLFLALILVYYATEPHSFSLPELVGGKFLDKSFILLGEKFNVATVAFSLVGVGLLLRAPVWPFHGWFTQFSEEAPPSLFVVVSAAINHVAVYVFIRVCYSLFPETMREFSNGIIAIGAINLVMGGLFAISQVKINQLLSYLSMSQLGLILLGIGSLNDQGLVGSMYLMLALGLSLAGFGFVYGLIRDRTGSGSFYSDNGEKILGGLASRAPVTAIITGIFIASLLGFPGFGGFVGQSLIFIGTFSAHPFAIGMAALAVGVTCYYLFNSYLAIFLGTYQQKTLPFLDLNIRERIYLFPLVIFIIFFGLYPKLLLDIIRPTLAGLIAAVK